MGNARALCPPSRRLRAGARGGEGGAAAMFGEGGRGARAGRGGVAMATGLAACWAQAAPPPAPCKLELFPLFKG